MLLTFKEYTISISGMMYVYVPNNDGLIPNTSYTAKLDTDKMTITRCNSNINSVKPSVTLARSISIFCRQNISQDSVKRLQASKPR